MSRKENPNRLVPYKEIDLAYKRARREASGIAFAIMLTVMRDKHG